MLRGERPRKPTNALDIGFSDSLWAFTQLCWQCEVELRPDVGKVVAHLGKAAADWNTLMPPLPPCSDPEEPVSDSEEFGEFEIMLSQHCAHRATVQISSFCHFRVTPQSVLPSSQPLSCTHLGPQVLIQSRSEDPHEDFHVVTPHLNPNSHCDPPLFRLPKRPKLR